jgi:type IV pilus assembly protein PilF
VKLRNAVAIAAAAAVLFSPGCAGTSPDRKKEAVARMQMAVTYLDQSNIPMAMRELSSAASLDPENPEVDLVTAEAYSRRGDLGKAESRLRDALAKKPDYAEAHNNLGRVYSQEGRGDEAIREFQAAAANVYYTTPEYAFFNMGVEYGRQGKTDPAIEAFRRAIVLNERYTDAYRALARLLADAGRWADAAATLKGCLKFYPGDPVLLFESGIALRQTGQKKEALEAFRAVLEKGNAVELRDRAAAEINALSSGRDGAR